MIKPKKSGLPVFVFLVFVLSTAPAVGAAYAQPRAPAFGKPGEPVNLVVGFQPYYVVTWTAAMRDAKLHIGYIGDAVVPLAAAQEPDIRLIAVAALSQDQCIVVARRDAPVFATPAEAVRWLEGKRIAVLPGTCMERITRADLAPR